MRTSGTLGLRPIYRWNGLTAIFKTVPCTFTEGLPDAHTGLVPSPLHRPRAPAKGPPPNKSQPATRSPVTARFFGTVEQPVATLSEHPRFPTGTSPAAGAAQRPATDLLARLEPP